MPQPTDNTIQIGGEEVPITHRDKIFWPKEGITKGDLLDYYASVASVMLPYLQDRLHSLLRHPDGITGESFYQKNIVHDTPQWVHTRTLPTSSTDGETRYLLCTNAATLLYMVNLGCIEINPWGSRVKRLHHPDYLILDLDPEGVAFARVIETAQGIHRLLTELDIPSVCKTSGKTGLHIFIPLGAHYTYDHTRTFAEILARLAHERMPKFTSVERSPAKRPHAVYIDFLQNSMGQTLAAPYCVRPVAGAPVSTPLHWSEVTSTLDPKRFTMRTTHQRIQKIGDLWKDVLGAGVRLEDKLEDVENL